MEVVVTVEFMESISKWDMFIPWQHSIAMTFCGIHLIMSNLCIMFTFYGISCITEEKPALRFLEQTCSIFFFYSFFFFPNIFPFSVFHPASKNIYWLTIKLKFQLTKSYVLWTTSNKFTEPKVMINSNGIRRMTSVNSDLLHWFSRHLRLNSQHKIAWSILNLINILFFLTAASGLFYVFNQRSTL